jgi:transcriptional regulator with XRE-family HTH domain
LSLADVAKRSGMDKGRLSRLENDPHPNVTLDTVDRYAAALGKQVVCALADVTDA